jgi:hypothetical protein
VWVLLYLDGKFMSFINIHVPNDIEAKVSLWEWLVEYLLEMDYLLCRDFNNVEAQDDKFRTNLV